VSRGPWLLGLAALTACAPRPVAAGPQTCAPGSATLGSEADAGALTGEYRLRLVATSGPRRDSSTDGSLTLAAADSATRSRAVHRYTLLGHGELELGEVGAAEADVTSRDPMRPGALVFDLGRPVAAPSSRVLVRLGAEANRQDVMRLEGAYTVLRVRAIDEAGFSGEWASGAPLPVAEGYFCAWRASTPAE
jgi:hypothetical protein